MMERPAILFSLQHHIRGALRFSFFIVHLLLPIHYMNGAAIRLHYHKEKHMTFAELCIFLTVLFCFGTLILKVVEISRGK